MLAQYNPTTRCTICIHIRAFVYSYRKLHSLHRSFFLPFHSNLESADRNDTGHTCKNCFLAKLDPNSREGHDDDIVNDDEVGDGSHTFMT